MASMTRDKKCEIIAAAGKLFRRQGYAGTGLSEILAESNAPKGSLYHYFPDGKEAIGVAAIEEAGQTMERELLRYRESGARSDELLMMTARHLGEWLQNSGFCEGCGIATTVLETSASSERLREAGERAYASWRKVIEDCLLSENVAPARAERLAALVMSALQGGLIQSRVSRSTEHLTVSAEEVASLLRAAREDAAAQRKSA